MVSAIVWGILALLGALFVARGGTATPGNDPPVADFDVTVDGLTIVADASASADPDGQITDYMWDIGGEMLSGIQIEHTFAEAGVYVVALAVMDDDGATASAEQEVAVSAPGEPPVANFDTDHAGLTVTFDASASSDPDGSIASFEWAIGGQPFEGETVTVTFDTPGDVTVTLQITDDDGNEDSITRTIGVDETAGYGLGLYGGGPYGDPEGQTQPTSAPSGAGVGAVAGSTVAAHAPLDADPEYAPPHAHGHAPGVESADGGAFRRL